MQGHRREPINATWTGLEWDSNLRPYGSEAIPAYPWNIGADVLVLAVKAQHKTEIWEHAEGDEDWTGVRVIGQVPQGCRQLRGVKGQDEGKRIKKVHNYILVAFLVEGV